MYFIDENEVHTIEQVINKVTLVRKLSDLGRNQDTHMTSDEVATLFMELEDQLKEIRSGIKSINQAVPLDVPSE